MTKFSKRLPEDYAALLAEVKERIRVYCDLPKVQPLVAQIDWSHNLSILQRCKDPLEREFYIRMTLRNNHVKLEDINAKVAILAATIKKNFEELGV